MVYDRNGTGFVPVCGSCTKGGDMPENQSILELVFINSVVVAVALGIVYLLTRLFNRKNSAQYPRPDDSEKWFIGS